MIHEELDKTLPALQHPCTASLAEVLYAGFYADESAETRGRITSGELAPNFRDLPEAEQQRWNHVAQMAADSVKYTVAPYTMAVEFRR